MIAARNIDRTVFVEDSAVRAAVGCPASAAVKVIGRELLDRGWDRKADAMLYDPTPTVRLTYRTDGMLRVTESTTGGLLSGIWPDSFAELEASCLGRWSIGRTAHKLMPLATVATLLRSLGFETKGDLSSDGWMRADIPDTRNTPRDVSLLFRGFGVAAKVRLGSTSLTGCKTFGQLRLLMTMFGLSGPVDAERWEEKWGDVPLVVPADSFVPCRQSQV